jgi:hypothetical protein
MKVASSSFLPHNETRVVWGTRRFMPCWSHPASYNHPLDLAILAASTRLAAPSLLIASDR